MPSVSATLLEDAHQLQNGGSFSSTLSYFWMLRHTSTANAYTAAIRFSIPDTIPIASISNTVITLRTANTGTFYGSATFESNSPTLASNLTTRYNTASSQNGSVVWNQPTDPGGGADINSPDLSTPLKNALTNSTSSGGVYTVSMLFKADIGAPAGIQIISQDNPSTAKPAMTVTYTAPPNFTATIDSPIGVTPTLTNYARVEHIDVPYYSVSALGTGSAASQRLLDLYQPMGNMPSNGWPVIVYIHGGRFVTGGKGIAENDENYIQASFIEKMNQNGYAVASIAYRLMQENINPGAIFRSFPQNVHDVFASLKWIEQNAATYSLDNAKVVTAGHSAGGYLAAFATIAARSGDSTTYNGRQNSSGNRDAGYGYSDTASPWQYDLDENAELSLANPPVGLMLWDAPIDLYQITTIGGLAGTANANARKALMGEVTTATIFSNEDECDINHFIAGDGTVYTTPKPSSAIPPIYFMYSSTQDLIPNSGSITAMYNSLSSVGYDVSTSVGTLNTNSGLTRHSVARDHATVLRGQAPNYTQELQWLSEVAPATTTHYVGNTGVTTMKVGNSNVTAAYLGNTQIWP